MRGTGNTTKVIYQALMSDKPVVFVFAKTSEMARRMKKLLIEYGGKPDIVESHRVVIGGKTYLFNYVHTNVHQALLGFKDYDIFYDHLVFEMDTAEAMQELKLLNEITLHKRAQTDG